MSLTKQISDFFNKSEARKDKDNVLIVSIFFLTQEHGWISSKKDFGEDDHFVEYKKPGGLVMTTKGSRKGGKFDLVFEAARDTTVEEINAAIKTAADGRLKGILGYTERPNVSMDFNHDPHSSVFHMDQTKVMDARMCRILSWYDNEWGFSNRMADTAVEMGKYL